MAAAVLAAAGLLLLLAWRFVAAQFTVTSGGAGGAFLAGDHILVWRAGCAASFPFTGSAGGRGTERKFPRRGEWVAFSLSSAAESGAGFRSAAVGRCVSLPGDTVRLTRAGVPVSGAAGGSAPAFVVPAKGAMVEVTPANSRLLCAAINRHEPCHSAAMYGDTLFVDGHAARFVSFTQDFFWILLCGGPDGSPASGLVPEACLIGRVSRILYSIDPGAPLWRKFRRDRFLAPLRPQRP